MNTEVNKLNGFLIHPWDLLDEGAIAVLDNLRGLGFNSVFVGINSIAQKHPPFPVKAQLTHNPKRTAHISEKGTYYYNFNKDLYEKMHMPLQKTIAPNIVDRDALSEATKHKEEFNIKVYAWVKLLSNDYLAEECPEYSVVNSLGERNEQWLCFNNPNVEKFQIELIKEIITKYNIEGILLDGVQHVYPYLNLLWLHRGFTCFCEHCQLKMRKYNIDIDRLKQELTNFHESIKTFDLKDLEKFRSKNLEDIKSIFYDKIEIYKWIYFKFRTLNKFIAKIYREIKNYSKDSQLGVSMWSPRSSWMVGQSYKMISQNCDWIMPMIYRRMWGLFSYNIVQELKKNVRGVSFFQKIRGKANKELLESFFKFNNFKGPYELYKLRHGVDPDIIRSEIEEIDYILNEVPLSYERQKDWGIAHMIRYLFENPDKISPRFYEFEFPKPKKVPIYPSIELWDPASKEPTPPLCRDSVKKAKEAKTDGFIFQSYGWAPMQNIYAISEDIKESQS